MVAVHRHGDTRECGATTVVTGQSTVFVNSVLVAVVGDECTHLEGDLVSTSPGTVRVNGKKVIVITDTNTEPDSAAHVSPADDPASGSPNVFAY